MPGRPDILLLGARIAVFCDGDFWHGRDWEARRPKLGRGTNSAYWLAKIQANIDRDQRNTRRLQETGWTVLRFWESEIRSNPAGVVRTVLDARHLRESFLPVDLDSVTHCGVKEA